MLKIVLCSPVSISYWGGAEKKLCEIGRLLKLRGHEVEMRALPYEYEGRKVDPIEVLKDIPYIESWKQKIEADLTYVYYQPLVWRLFRIQGPKIAGLHSAGLIHCITPYIYLAFRLFGRVDLSSFDAVHVVSPILEVKHRRIQLIPNWIDLGRYRPTSNKEDKFTILYVGRHRKEKGWPHFLRLCKELDKRGYEFNYWCTGKGSPPVEGFSYVNYGISTLYSRAHLVVYPSLVDTFGLVIVESLACGTPVITTPIKAHVLLDMPVRYAFTLNEFIDGVVSVYEDWRKGNGLYEELVQKGQDKVRKYDINRIFPHLEKMFLQIANSI
jgi:glycosyltransferase involved in cell wall biosynthesis